jgi:hypothetical protein
VLPPTDLVFKPALEAGDPESARQAVSDWLAARGGQPEAAFVFRLWLDAGGERELVAAPVSAWLEKYGERLDASFVLRAWLNSGGKWRRVKGAVALWLDRYDQEPDARHVLVAWLTAGAPRRVVRDHLPGWPERNGIDRKAGFVLRAWLGRKGDLLPVLAPAIAWLQEHWPTTEVNPVLKLVAARQDLPVEAVRELLRICRRHPKVEGALARLLELEQHLLAPGLAAEAVVTCEAVAEEVMAAAVPSRHLCALLARLFSVLGSDRTLRTATRPLFLRWLRHPASYGPIRNLDSLPLLEAEPSSLLYVVDALAAGELSLEEDREPLSRFLSWMTTWDPEHRERVREFLAERAGGGAAP